jgi:hypothetical protein
MFGNQEDSYEFRAVLHAFSVVFWQFVAFGSFCAIPVLGLSYFLVVPAVTSLQSWSLYIALAIAAIGVIRTSALLIQYYINRAYHIKHCQRLIAQSVTCDQLDR